MPRVEVFNKEEVLTNTILTFWKKGFHGTSMQDLVDATRLNRSSIYNSFGNKNELYEIALKKYQKERSALLQNSLIKAGNPREALQLIFTEIISQMHENKYVHGCFEINSKTEMGHQNEVISQLLLKSEEQQLDFFEHLIKDGQNRGLINERQSASEYAFLIFNAYQGIQLSGIFIKNKESLQTIAHNSLRILM